MRLEHPCSLGPALTSGMWRRQLQNRVPTDNTPTLHRNAEYRLNTAMRHPTRHWSYRCGTFCKKEFVVVLWEHVVTAVVTKGRVSSAVTSSHTSCCFLYSTRKYHNTTDIGGSAHRTGSRLLVSCFSRFLFVQGCYTRVSRSHFSRKGHFSRAGGMI
jgi:hypothetical protein